VPLTDDEEAAVLIKRAPGGLESLPEKDRAGVAAMHDEQLDRADDLLKGLLLYDKLTAAPRPEKVAAK